jgi:hypothetical protein
MTTTRATLTTAEQLHLRQAAERLKRRFEGELNTETIERFLYDSLDRLWARRRRQRGSRFSPSGSPPIESGR